MKIIDGNHLANKLRENLKKDIKDNDLCPGLAIIYVGNNPASEVYVRNKLKTCVELGIEGNLYHFEENARQEEIISKIKALNEDKKVHGIIIQSPVPKKYDEDLLNSYILKEKDVDGFGIYNVGSLTANKEEMLAATPAGVIKMLESENIKISGKHVVMVGRSKIVGRPLAMMFLNRDATVTIAHSKTENLKDITKLADIFVVAIGKPLFIKKGFIKKGAVVIDVGINRLSDKIVGDVDFLDVKKKTSFITPVPGGVGPMTITMLLANVVDSAKEAKERGK